MLIRPSDNLESPAKFGKEKLLEICLYSSRLVRAMIDCRESEECESGEAEGITKLLPDALDFVKSVYISNENSLHTLKLK